MELGKDMTLDFFFFFFFFFFFRIDEYQLISCVGKIEWSNWRHISIQKRLQFGTNMPFSTHRVKFSILKLLWYGKNIICVFTNHECIQKQKQNNTKHLGQFADKHTTSMRWTQGIAGMSYAERGWSHKCRVYAAGDRTVACGPMTNMFAITCGSTADVCRINCVHRTDVRTFSCDKRYLSRKLVSQLWPKVQLVRVFCVHLRLVANPP